VSDHRAVAVRFELPDPDLPEDTGTSAIVEGTAADTGPDVPNSPSPGVQVR
jgi:hypothetical protein